MAASGMAVGNIGVGAFNPPSQIGTHEQVKDAIYRIGGHPLTPIGPHAFGNVISRGRFLPRGQSGKHIGAHIGPLFACLNQGIARGVDQLFASEIVMVVMPGHGAQDRGRLPEAQISCA